MAGAQNQLGADGPPAGVPTNGPVGFYGTTPIARPSSTGQVAGFTANLGNAVQDNSTITGGIGSTAYTVGDIVRHLKSLGLIAP